MPLDLHQYERREILCHLLKMSLTKKELLEKLNRKMQEKFGSEKGISERTLVYDIKRIENEGAHIHRPTKSDPSYYFEGDFKTRVELQLDERELLQQCIALLKNIKGFSVANDMQQLLRKIESSGYGTDAEAYIAFEDHNLAMGTEHIDNLVEAIKNHSVLNIQYEDFNEGKKRQFDFSPYFLKEYRNRWYVFGITHDGGKLLNLGLDRISKLKPSKVKFIANTTFNASQHFTQLIGVTIPDGSTPIDIVLKISKESAKYVLSKKIIDNQILLDQYKDGSIKVKIIAHNNYELKQNLLGYGAALKVISPASLVLEMKNILLKAAKLYN
ncbi:MAG TPA: WYL domain-containing protein [Chitinophagaceae bacterium]|jgi:predicted DNA-binding transcriptional regulator YafY|nr:WYL domain-containing protein [Chitinophagaceae bacterium]